MKKSLKKASILALTALVVTGCGDVKVEPAEANPLPHDMKQGEGLFSGESGNILDVFSSRKQEGSTLFSDGSVLVPVNPYLWRASLEAVSFMSLAQTDSTGGSIITDWYTNPNNPNERIKANILVLGRQFQVQNLKVNLFKQEKQQDSWVNVSVDPATTAQLEDTILTSARKMKVKAQAE